MSIVAYVRSLIGGNDSTEGLGALRDLLAEREAEMTLTAKYGEPSPNMTDEPTVTFPYTVYTNDGVTYRVGAKEFVLPDNGLQDADTPLARFIAQRNGIEPSEVTFEDLAAIEGQTADVTLSESGDLEVAA